MVTYVDPQEVFKYARKKAEMAEKLGKGTVYPNMRTVARRFKCSYDVLESSIEDYDGEDYLGIAVGFKTTDAFGLYNNRGEQLVEAY